LNLLDLGHDETDKGMVGHLLNTPLDQKLDKRSNSLNPNAVKKADSSDDKLKTDSAESAADKQSLKKRKSSSVSQQV